MSHAYYSTRLYWAGNHGVAKLRGVSVALSAPPVVRERRVESVDYTPEVGVYLVAYPGEARRDMMPEEIAAVDQFLTLATADDWPRG